MLRLCRGRNVAGNQGEIMKKNHVSTTPPPDLLSMTALGNWTVPNDLDLVMQPGGVAASLKPQTPVKLNAEQVQEGRKQQDAKARVDTGQQPPEPQPKAETHTQLTLQLAAYYQQVDGEKIQGVLHKFTAALRNSRRLGWMSDLPYPVIELTPVPADTPSQTLSEVQVLLSADVCNVTPQWLTLGKADDSAQMQSLLLSGWPKRLKIRVSLSNEMIQQASPAKIASQVAYQIGTHVAPYWQLLGQALIRNRLSVDGADTLLVQWQQPNKTQLDRRRLHVGFLTTHWRKWFKLEQVIDLPVFRELIALLGHHHVSRTDQAYLWQCYCQEVARVPVFSVSGTCSQAQQQKQTDFYLAYEAYANKQGRFPWGAKLKVFSQPVSAVLLSLATAAVLYANGAAIMGQMALVSQWLSAMLSQ